MVLKVLKRAMQLLVDLFLLYMWLLHSRLEMLDKADAPSIHESYPMAVAYTALLDAVKSITIAVEDLQLPSSNTHCESVTGGVCLCLCVSMLVYSGT